MNKEKLFDPLKRQHPDTLIELLDNCYTRMKTTDIREVFGSLEDAFLYDSFDNGQTVLRRVQEFMDDSLKGTYYAPFNMNSKNHMNIPEETERWFEKLSDLLVESTQLTTQGDHVHAVKCFRILYQLIDHMESGEEIIFADEAGIWMLPISEEPCIQAYFESAAAIFEAADYVEAVLPIIRHDRPSNINKALQKAQQSANEQQKALLEEKVVELRRVNDCD